MRSTNIIFTYFFLFSFRASFALFPFLVFIILLFLLCIMYYYYYYYNEALCMEHYHARSYVCVFVRSIPNRIFRYQILNRRGEIHVHIRCSLTRTNVFGFVLLSPFIVLSSFRTGKNYGIFASVPTLKMNIEHRNMVLSLKYSVNLMLIFFENLRNTKTRDIIITLMWHL